ncbi:hypothetical protein BCJMU51_5458 [Bacillus cereus]|nr:hypothetical protein BCM0045_5435 [Bacillus cereus]BCC03376.1 hypothetical protein BCM0057_5458 [Bacillus cereus]BCC26895.1 hypothetical protein BCM0079_5488 [Bacillus cereus]BCC38455.1 hypothetical protein BCM0105_5445 [Bacillus cereus]BCC44253.1 hypothetical protein BCJMU01_5420 [Bacillus cereus]
MNLLINTRNIVIPTQEELKRQELIGTLAKLIKLYAQSKQK